MSGWGEARRLGKCPHCNTPVSPGDRIYNRDGVWLCYTCGTEAEQHEGEIVVGGLEEAVIKDLGKFPDEARDGAFAQSMLLMARQLDHGDVNPREVTQYTKELRLMMMQLRDLFPPEIEDDETDAARKRRDRRARESGGF
jgi:hypothetical protein